MNDNKLVETYPFLRDKDPQTYMGEKETWADQLPAGWREKFMALCGEVNAALAEAGLENTKLSFAQVKEKYGQARIYWDLDISIDDTTGIYDRLDKMFATFEHATRQMCADCGKDSTHTSKHYILPYCYKCASEWLDRYREIKMNKHAKFVEHFRREKR